MTDECLLNEFGNQSTDPCTLWLSIIVLLVILCLDRIDAVNTFICSYVVNQYVARKRII